MIPESKFILPCGRSSVDQFLIRIFLLIQDQLDPVGISLSIRQHEDACSGFFIMNHDCRISVRIGKYLCRGKGFILHRCAPAAVYVIGFGGKQTKCGLLHGILYAQKYRNPGVHIDNPVDERPVQIDLNGLRKFNNLCLCSSECC